MVGIIILGIINIAFIVWFIRTHYNPQRSYNYSGTETFNTATK